MPCLRTFTDQSQKPWCSGLQKVAVKLYHSELLQSSSDRSIPVFRNKGSHQGWLACFSCLCDLLMRKFPCRETRKVCACSAILTCASWDNTHWLEGAEIWMGPKTIAQQMLFMWHPRMSKCMRDWKCLRFSLSNSRYLIWFNEGGQEGCGLMKEGAREKLNQNRGCRNSCLKNHSSFLSEHTFLNWFFTLFNYLCMYIYF